MKVIIIENNSGEHSFVARKGAWTGLYDANLLLKEFLDEAAHALSEDDYLLPEDYIEKLLSTDAPGFCYYLNKWARTDQSRWEFSCARVSDMLIINMRETAALLAALRLYQSTNKGLKELQQVLDITSNNGLHAALDDVEIKTLIHKINYA
jgi:hypothetical protein